MIIVGLDISSTSTGWAVLREGKFLSKEGRDFGFIKPPKKLELSEKLHFFRNELVYVLESTLPDMVGIEDVFSSRNLKTFKLLSRFSGVGVEAVRSLLALEPEIVSVTQVRSCIGPQDKKSAFSKICDIYNKSEWVYEKHNDVADALAIAHYLYSNRSK